MRNGNIINYKANSKSNYSPITSERKSDLSPIMIAEKLINNNIYSQYPNYINPINYISNPNRNTQYPNYFTNYNTSNNYHINTSQQNFYYEKNNSKYNRNVYPEDNYVQNNYNENYINKSTNRKLIKGGKQKIRSVSNDKNMKKKRNNNYVNLDIINCETQYPLMTCFNADPYNRLQKKRLIQNYNNINNYANNNAKTNNEIIVASNEEKMNSIRSENIFNNQIKNKSKNTKLNNSCYNIRQKIDLKHIESLKGKLKKYNDLIYANVYNNDNNNKKSKLKDIVLNTDYDFEGKLSKINKYLNNNNKSIGSIITKKNDKDIYEKNNLENNLKKFIGLIERYFIKSFNKLFHKFLSQMTVFIKEKIYENKNSLLKRFQRVRNNKIIENKTNNYTPNKTRKLDLINNNVNKKLYIPKKQYKYMKPIKNKIDNIKIITSHNNLQEKKINYQNTDYSFRANEIPFKKRIIHKNNHSVDNVRNRGINLYNRNRSQENLLLKKKLSPNIPTNNKTKFNLRTNINDISNKNGLIYTKKRTNKFQIYKKYITDHIFRNNMNMNNNNKENSLTFINLYGLRSPNNNKFKVNERYDYDYEQKENDDTEDTIEQTIIKDICTYDNKFSVFIKYVTSQRYEQNYLRLKLLKYQNLYLNHKLEYSGLTHTDSIYLPSIYRNSNLIMNEIVEEKETSNFSNIQEDEDDINKLFSMVNIIETFYKQNLFDFYYQFFNSLKYINKYSNPIEPKKRNNTEEKMQKSKTYFNWKYKKFLKVNDVDIRKKFLNIDLVNDIIKRSKSVKILNKENNDINYFDSFEQRQKIENKVSLLRLNLLNYALKKKN